MILLIRTDASAEIGIGHLMRCLALAQAWRDEGGQVIFVMAEGGRQFATRLQSEGFLLQPIVAEVGSVDDSQQTLALAADLGSDWVVVDGYRFGSTYQHALKAGRVRQLFLDDCGHADSYCADLVLNQNLHADASLYPQCEPSVRLLFGLDYLLLRREFHNFPQSSQVAAKPRRILLTFGGSDPDNLTGRVLDVLQTLDVRELEICAVIGATNPHRSVLDIACQNSLFSARLESGVTDMTQLYRWADLAITGGGSTLWELAYMGVPALTMILAENQEPSSVRLDHYGSIQCLGYPEKLSQNDILAATKKLLDDVPRRQRMSDCGRRLVDGQGALRVVQLLLDAIAAGEK